MCLVVIGFQIQGGDPVLIAANREESRRRPATSPVCCRRGSLRCLLAGADHGPDGSFPEMGTWLGVNEAGLAVAVTNRRDGELAWEDQIRSRGLLAASLLGCDDVQRAQQRAQSQLALGGYGGCNLLLASPDRAFVVQAPGSTRISVVELTPGVHAISNLDVDDGDDPRIRFVAASLEPHDFLASAQRVCRDERVIISGAERGTVSSSILRVGREIVLDHILGDPTGGEYEEFRLFARHQKGIRIP
jgi:uncharacterized protein with NRDE domain